MADPTFLDALAKLQAEVAELRAASVPQPAPPPAAPFNPLAFLDGNKTYILAGVAMLVMALQSLGYLTNDQAKTLLELLGAGTVATLRHAIGKVQAMTSDTNAVVKGEPTPTA